MWRFCFQNPQLMLGYWKDPERTEACFVNGQDGRWYVTGDRAERDADGYLWYRGRADDVINSAGYRIGPLEVENALAEHPAVRACAVVGSPDVERGEIVKAFVVLRDGVTPSPELTRGLQDHVKAVTAPYKYPRAIEYISELPMTITGRIRRHDFAIVRRCGRRRIGTNPTLDHGRAPLLAQASFRSDNNGPANSIGGKGGGAELVPRL